MKTIKELFEVYKPKSPDEQRFVDKHVTIKHKDRNGNDDDVFNGSNVKTVKRKEERHGYDVGEDEKVYEETEAEKNAKDTKKTFPNVKYFTKSGHPDWKKHGIDNPVKEEAEELDEISAMAKDAYAQKAGKQLTGLFKKSGSDADAARKYYNRKNTVRKIANEAAEQIDEAYDKIINSKKYPGLKIHQSSTTGAVKLTHPDHPDMKLNYSRARDRYRHQDHGEFWYDKLWGIASKYHKHGPSLGKTNEAVEDLDELSKGVLSSYVIKATHPSRENSISNLASKGGFKNATSLVGSDDDRDPNKNGEKEDSKSAKRSLGVIRAVSKLTKEDIINRTIEKYITPDMPTPLTMEERLVTKIVDLSESHIYLLLDLFESLSEDNKMRMLEQVETSEGVTELLDFAIENRGV
jgi:hypothetical protein